jgi:outer membrane protein OmpA-like peptidoglycan-associated protein
VLEEIYTFLKDNNKVIIEIGGHTNSLPEDEYCDRLSTSRAKNIAQHLYGKGIPESQIAYKGYGKRQPIATNQTVEGRRRNQRVEIKIVSL